MSRRLNREVLPLQKTEAMFFMVLRPLCVSWLGAWMHSHSFSSPSSMQWCNVEDHALVFDLRGHTYCCGSERGVFHTCSLHSDFIL